MDSLSDTDRAYVLQHATKQFWKHIVPIVVMAFIIHVLLLVAFAALGVVPLLVGNSFSVLAYLFCLKAIRQGSFEMAGLVMSVEIILHAILATWVLGWASNFYFYLFCVVPIIAFSFQAAPVKRGLLSSSIVLVALVGFAWRDSWGQGAAALSSVSLEAFGMVNVVIAIGLLLQATTLSERYALAMQLHLFHSANRDSLTNLYTRRRVTQAARHLPSQGAVSLLLLDIDHFKQINDRHGHEIGDRVLQQVAKVLEETIGERGMAARWGGEEFVLLMFDTPLAQAKEAAEHIRKHLRRISAELDFSVTATFAVAEFGDREALARVLQRVDQALYQGKLQGRDRVMLAR
ncbi:GGDEF domain-containing protein [Pseudomonas massiliensis]|uniref:GGDEF domain-containing protein n=1 Tax=Pseudomonas massiliensis TaxID=522492 RepID=UPI00058EA208|nr:GGDEF domain-containing protein [Pseudomonas massiliensis]